MVKVDLKTSGLTIVHYVDDVSSFAGGASIDACNIQCNANIYVTKKNHCNVGVACPAV